MPFIKATVEQKGSTKTNLYFELLLLDDLFVQEDLCSHLQPISSHQTTVRTALRTPCILLPTLNLYFAILQPDLSKHLNLQIK